MHIQPDPQQPDGPSQPVNLAPAAAAYCAAAGAVMNLPVGQTVVHWWLSDESCLTTPQPQTCQLCACSAGTATHCSTYPKEWALELGVQVVICLADNFWLKLVRLDTGHDISQLRHGLLLGGRFLPTTTCSRNTTTTKVCLLKASAVMNTARRHGPQTAKLPLCTASACCKLHRCHAAIAFMWLWRSLRLSWGDSTA